ncbi:Fur family transcriptional regulator [Cupriavidus sp. RAF12]|uniref:Fur family transcriptional regulator n=1 Tax=Cupriavidus sp. RAF12 TaxID=3233050 RepID=UPI003F8DE9BC
MPPPSTASPDARNAEQATWRLATHGLADTIGRRAAILLLLESPQRHQTADALCAAMLVSRHRCALSSFRKAIYELAAAGVLARVTVCPFGSHQMHYYELAERPHHHLFCVCCHRIDEVADGILDDLQQRALRAHGLSPVFAISGAMHGVCAACASAGTNSAARADALHHPA